MNSRKRYSLCRTASPRHDRLTQADISQTLMIKSLNSQHSSEAPYRSSSSQRADESVEDKGSSHAWSELADSAFFSASSFYSTSGNSRLTSPSHTAQYTTSGYSETTAQDSDICFWDKNKKRYQYSRPASAVGTVDPVLRGRPSSANELRYTDQSGKHVDSAKLLQLRRKFTSEPQYLSQWNTHMDKAANDATEKRSTWDISKSHKTAHLMKDKMQQVSRKSFSKDEQEEDNSKNASFKKREKPWKQTTKLPARKLSGNTGKYVEIQYEKCITPNRWAECKPKKYVTNHKYGVHYESRCSKKASNKIPCPGKSFLWENPCQVWLLEKSAEISDSVFTDDSHRVQTQVSHQRPKTAPVTSRPQQNQETPSSRRRNKCTTDAFEQFYLASVAKQKQRGAAVVIQKYARGWLIRLKIKQLNHRCIRKHGCSFRTLCKDYRELLSRIQHRCGIVNPSCAFSYTALQAYMDKKEAYEQAFTEMTGEDNSLPRSKLLNYFNKCGLYPLQRELDAAFLSVFKGCGIQADVVCLLDCSASIGRALYDMQLNMIRALIGHCEVQYDKVMVAVIPYNDDVFQVIDFESYGTKDELLTELGNLTYDKVLSYGQITRTDLALKCAVELIKRVSEKCDHRRDGAKTPKLCLTFTDGQCYHTQLTRKWAELLRFKHKVSLIAVSCDGKNEQRSQFVQMTGDESKVIKLTDYATLGILKSAVQGQPCLKDCPLCQLTKQTKTGVISTCSNESRDLYKSEVLELIWMLYCPPAIGLKKYKTSLWMAPQVVDRNALRLTSFEPSDKNFRSCIRTAVEKKISEDGKVILPTETGSKVREITDVSLAMDFIDQLCVSKLAALGLVNKAGLYY